MHEGRQTTSYLHARGVQRKGTTLSLDELDGLVCRAAYVRQGLWVYTLLSECEVVFLLPAEIFVFPCCVALH